MANTGTSIHDRRYCAACGDVGDIHQLIVVPVTDQYYRRVVRGLWEETLDRGSARCDWRTAPEKERSWNDSREARVREEGAVEQDVTFVTHDETGNAEVHDLDLFRRVATGFRVATDWLEAVVVVNRGPSADGTRRARSGLPPLLALASW